MNIYLVGFMGTGKTSVGKLLAKDQSKLVGLGALKHGKWSFVDLDELIELKEQRRIVDIFAKEGEAYFRKIEKKILKTVATQKHFVVACGGGIVLDKDNIKVMKASGIVICLSASAKEIFKRVSLNSQRPLLNVAHPQKRIELLLKMRTPYYLQADKLIDTTDLTVKEVVKKIIKLIAARK